MFIQHANQSKADQLRLTSAFHHRKPMRRPVLISQHVVGQQKLWPPGSCCSTLPANSNRHSQFKHLLATTSWCGVGLAAFTFCPLHKQQPHHLSAIHHIRPAVTGACTSSVLQFAWSNSDLFYHQSSDHQMQLKCDVNICIGNTSPNENIFQQWMLKADFCLPLSSYGSSFGDCLFDFVPLTDHVRSKEPAATSVGLCEFDRPD
ncbi:hypothetical protein T10_5777 [Trichinella papuae]|uniref:Uncharacterized protein n=1 Tax=Trichinella papuae TaxID=268474 RepID=A0A0V1MN66_9BILA|nr:hypothetical protein T10_5777 [Trichinella papuae]